MSKYTAPVEAPPTEYRMPEAHSSPTSLPPQFDFDEQRPSKNYWWVWLLIFAGITYGCYRLYVFEQGKKEATDSAKAAMKPRVISVVAAAARSGNMPVYLEGLGTVTPFNTVIVRPRVDGQLTAVTFKEGQFVKKGELLAEIDPRPFQVALSQAEGMLAEARGNLEKDRASLRDAQVNYERYKALFADQIIAKQQLDTQLATADQVRGSIAADDAAIAAAQAQIDSAKLNLAWTRVDAPISGRIGLRQVDAGNMVHATDTNGLATIDQVQPIAVLFTLPEDQLPEVLKRLQHGATMRVDGYDRDDKQKLAAGTLATVDNQIDPTTGTSRLKAVFPNPDLALFPNQFVNARLWLDTEKNVTIVPATAIQRGPTGTFVYVVKDDNTVAVRPVKIGMTEGNDVTIDEGIKPGERVVVDGAEKLTDGMQVNLNRSSSSSS